LGTWLIQSRSVALLTALPDGMAAVSNRTNAWRMPPVPMSLTNTFAHDGCDSGRRRLNRDTHGPLRGLSDVRS
jgi:hypothetical protein